MERACLRRNHEGLEALAHMQSDSFVRAHPKISIGSGHNQLYQFAWQPLSATKARDAVTVITEQSCLCPDPEKALRVLRHGEDSSRAKSKLFSEMLNRVVRMIRDR